LTDLVLCEENIKHHIPQNRQLEVKFIKNSLLVVKRRLCYWHYLMIRREEEFIQKPSTKTTVMHTLVVTHIKEFLTKPGFRQVYDNSKTSQMDDLQHAH